MAAHNPFGFLAATSPSVQTPARPSYQYARAPRPLPVQAQPSYTISQDDGDLSDSEEEYEFETAKIGAESGDVGRSSPAIAGEAEQVLDLGSPEDIKPRVAASLDEHQSDEEDETRLTPQERKERRKRMDLAKINAKFPWYREGMTVPYSKMVQAPIASNGIGGPRGLRSGPEMEVDFVPMVVPRNAFRTGGPLDLVPRQRRTIAWAAPATARLAKRDRVRAAAKQRDDVLASGMWIKRDTLRSSSNTRTSANPLSVEGIASLKAENRMSMVELSNWEDQIVFGPQQEDEVQPTKANKRQKVSGAEQYKAVNKELESGDWLDEVRWGALPVNGEVDGKRNGIEEETDEEDRMTVEEDLEALSSERPSQDTQRQRAVEFVAKARFDPHGKPLDYLNLSKDYLYQPPKGMKVKVGQGAGRPDVRDAVPAARFDLPWYHPQPSEKDKRYNHRPALMFPTNSTITFEKLAAPHNKTKKEKAERRLGGKARKLVEIPQNSRELTLGERPAGVLLEYSEEQPLAMSKYGMGAVICNYYRKEKEEEETIPTFKLGHPVVLPTDAAEPFPLTFLEPSSTMQSVENDLFRAPIFPHTASKCDFLVIRQTTASGSKYLLKPIENLFVVGQTYPNKISVPIPGSREYTQSKKELLWNILYRAVQRDPLGLGQIEFSKIGRLYPGEERNVILGRMKEVMVSTTRGERSGTTLMRLRTSGDEARAPRKVVSAGELLNAEFLTPAFLAAVESADAALQWYKDSGYGEPTGSRNEAEAAQRPEVTPAESGDLGNTLERRLAPWRQHVVYNKLNSGTHALNGTRSQLVELQGPGDPTGRGEGFSLLMAGPDFAESLVGTDTKIKGKSKEHTELLRRAYLEKQILIWNRQRWSLVNTNPPMLDQYGSDTYSDEDSREGDHDEDDEDDDAMSYSQQSRSRFGASRAGSTFSRLNGSDLKREVSAAPHEEDYGVGHTNHLKITRIGRDGLPVVEYITDERIYKAYITKKIERGYFLDQKWKANDSRYDPRTNNLIEQLIKEIIVKSRERQRLKTERKIKPKGANRTVHREAGQGGWETGPDGTVIRKVTCKACGQKGHTRTQKAQCPAQNGSTRA